MMAAGVVRCIWCGIQIQHIWSHRSAGGWIHRKVLIQQQCSSQQSPHRKAIWKLQKTVIQTYTKGSNLRETWGWRQKHISHTWGTSVDYGWNCRRWSPYEKPQIFSMLHLKWSELFKEDISAILSLLKVHQWTNGLNGFRCDQRNWHGIKTECSSVASHLHLGTPSNGITAWWFRCLELVKALAADHSGVTMLVVNGNYLGGTPSWINQVLWVSFGSYEKL